MRQRVILSLLCVLLLPILGGCAKSKPIENPTASQIKWQPYTGKKTKIIITDFKNNSGYGGTQYARSAQKMLSSALVQSGRFDVIEGDALGAVLAQQGFQNSGLTDAGTAAQIGKIINAKYIVLGSITELGESSQRTNGMNFAVHKLSYKTTTDISVIDAQTAQTVVADTQSATLEDKSFQLLGIGQSNSSDDSRLLATIRDAIDKSAPKIAEKMPFVAGADFKIASVSGGKVYVSAAAGELAAGTKLTVYRRGKEIVDPETKEVIDYEETKIGTVEVVEAKGKVTYCKIIDGSGFAAGDAVRP